MFRFLGFVWDESNRSHGEVAALLSSRVLDDSTTWTDAVDERGLRVMYTGARPCVTASIPLHGGLGTVLGTAFEHSTLLGRSPTCTQVPEEASRRILSSRGSVLFKTFWGEYVAFLRAESTVLLLRSPLSKLPCYLYRFDGVYICFSHLADLAKLRVPVSVNWQYIACVARFHRPLGAAETGLTEVTELRAGECAEMHGDEVQRTLYWNPFEIASGNVIEDPEEAARELRSTTMRCVHAWSSRHRGILHLLSGGIDSSILAVCLKESPTRPQLTFLNYYSEGSNTDERCFAREVAARAGVTLIEKHRASELNLDPLLTIRSTSPCPAYYLGYIEMSRLEASIAAEHQATAICTGVGGDQLFFQSHIAYSVGDYVQRRGIRPALLRIAYDAACIEKRSIWEVLRTGIDHGLLNQTCAASDDAPEERGFMAERLLADSQLQELVKEPWCGSAAAAPRGKRFQIRALLTPQFYYDPLGSEDDPVRFEPLLSQPLVEVCLRTPTYILARHGWTRWLARKAFEHDLPEDVIWRRTKGGMQEHMKAILLQNLPLIRSMLLDGLLVRNGLLDRTRLGAFLSLRPSRVHAGMAHVFEYLSLEAWLRSVGSTSGVLAV